MPLLKLTAGCRATCYSSILDCGNLVLIVPIFGPTVGILTKKYSENLKTVFSMRTISRWPHRRAHDSDDVIQFHSCSQKNLTSQASPPLGPRLPVKSPRVGKAIEANAPHIRGVHPLPLGLNIDRSITNNMQPSEKRSFEKFSCSHSYSIISVS